MGTMTINIPDEIEAGFRKTVEKEYGKGKGILGKAIAEAMTKWQEEKEQKEIAERMLARMRKGFKLGIGKPYGSRDEIYDRRIFPT
ncbi:hypothetical protein HYY69_06425 [Candidatus Woesearchaeota archaeon]|nr:hypothetical protein [Candidatus Woesearchaeota archaeon]